MRAAAERRLGPRGYWDRLCSASILLISKFSYLPLTRSTKYPFLPLTRSTKYPFITPHSIYKIPLLPLTRCTKCNFLPPQSIYKIPLLTPSLDLQNTPSYPLTRSTKYPFLPLTRFTKYTFLPPSIDLQNTPSYPSLDLQNTQNTKTSARTCHRQWLPITNVTPTSCVRSVTLMPGHKIKSVSQRLAIKSVSIVHTGWGQGWQASGTREDTVGTRHSLLSRLPLFNLPAPTVSIFCIYTHIWHRTDCIRITFATK